MMDMDPQLLPQRPNPGNSQALLFIILGLVFVIFFLGGLLWIKESVVDDIEVLDARVEDLETEVEELKGEEPVPLKDETSVLLPKPQQQLMADPIPSALAAQTKSFRDESYGFEIDYPSAFTLSTYKDKGPLLSGYSWNAVKLTGPNGVSLSLVVNPSGQGSLYPDLVYSLQEQNDGTLVVVSEHSADTSVESLSVTKALIIASLESKNGHSYLWLFEYPRESNQKEQFRSLLEGFRLLE